MTGAARREDCRRGRSGADDDAARCPRRGASRPRLVSGPSTSSSAAAARAARPGIPVAAVGEDADHRRARGPSASAREGPDRSGRTPVRAPPSRPRTSEPDGRAVRASEPLAMRLDAVTESTPTDSRQRPARPAQPFGLGPGGDDRVRDEQVVDAALGEDLGLADRGDGQPDRAGGELASPELEALVRLRVGPQGDAALAHSGGHPVDPRLDAIEVDDDGRRVERRRSRHRGRAHRQHLGCGRLGGAPVRGKIPRRAPGRRQGTARWAARRAARQEGVGDHDDLAQRRGLALESIAEVDPVLWEAMLGERRRQHDKIELIASENYASAAVMEAQGSWLTNKYAEGLPGKRYYGGCEYVDIAERLAQERALALFPGAEHVNVQPHSGAQANMAAYFSVLEPGDRIMGMNLAHGGHLTHGMALNFSGRLYEVHAYGVRQDTERIDYDAMAAQAREVRPEAHRRRRVAPIRGCGTSSGWRRSPPMSGRSCSSTWPTSPGSSPPDVHPSPFPHADLVTTTTHKTLRGPRGGMIFGRTDAARRRGRRPTSRRSRTARRWRAGRVDRQDRLPGHRRAGR